MDNQFVYDLIGEIQKSDLMCFSWLIIDGLLFNDRQSTHTHTVTRVWINLREMWTSIEPFALIYMYMYAHCDVSRAVNLVNLINISASAAISGRPKDREKLVPICSSRLTIRVAGVTWDFRPREKIAPSKGGDFFMHAEHEKFMLGDLLNKGDFFTWWIKRFCHEEIAPHAANMTKGSFLFILDTLISSCILTSSHNIKILKHFKSILWCLILL